VALLAFEDMKLLGGRSTECGYWIESSTGLGFKDLSMSPLITCHLYEYIICFCSKRKKKAMLPWVSIKTIIQKIHNHNFYILNYFTGMGLTEKHNRW
jgi:hypothetical protein